MSEGLRLVPEPATELGLVPAGAPGDRDWGYHAQKVAAAHLDACNEWQAYYEEGGKEGGNPPPRVPDPAIGPYCGCDTCIVRETLAAAWPVIEAAIRSGDFDETV